MRCEDLPTYIHANILVRLECLVLMVNIRIVSGERRMSNIYQLAIVMIVLGIGFIATYADDSRHVPGILSRRLHASSKGRCPNCGETHPEVVIIENESWTSFTCPVCGYEVHSYVEDDE